MVATDPTSFGLRPRPTDSATNLPVATLPKLPTPHPSQDRSTQRLNQFYSSRLALPLALSSISGFLLGTSHGAQTSALRFRAENSHRQPTNRRGWYLYHKTKNYYVTLQSAKEGARMAGKLAVWTAVFFSVEEVVDRGRVGRAYVYEDEGEKRDERRKKDVVSTVTAGMATSAAFSVWHRLPVPTAARMAKVGFIGGLGYGLAQDLLTVLHGQRLGYVDWMLRLTGLSGVYEKQVDG